MQKCLLNLFGLNFPLFAAGRVVNFWLYISTWLLIVTSVFILFILQGHTGLSFADEGFLWYGAQRVMLGEVPLRDFMAYDIGRYYWSAIFMSMWGNNGIIGLRVGLAFFQIGTLLVGLTVLMRSSKKQNIFFSLLALITLLVWMTPPYRMFDTSLPIVLFGVLALLVKQPSARRYFLTGLAVGLAAVFGRNHGLYGLVASLSVMAYLNIKRVNDKGIKAEFISFLLGAVAGYLPILIFLAFVPGFAQAFWESIQLLFEIKATNITLPVPWPWLVPFEKWSIASILMGVIQGTFFVAIVIFGLLGIIWAVHKKLKHEDPSPALVAAIFLALPYAHYAFSRADLEHLSPGIPPFILGMFALLSEQSVKVKWTGVLVLCGASAFSMFPSHAGWNCFAIQQCVFVNVAGDQILVDQLSAESLDTLAQLDRQFAASNQSFIVTPFWPGAYAAMSRKSPMWEIYALFPRSKLFQEAEINRIKTANPKFVLLYTGTIDNRDDLRFRSTHLLIDQYIRANFDFLSGYLSNPEFQVYINHSAKNQ